MQGQHRAAPLSPTSRILWALAASVLATISCAAAAVLAWKPEKAIEIIATNAPGGGSDRIIRNREVSGARERPGARVPDRSGTGQMNHCLGGDASC